ncbi:MAG: glycosyltransferase, partial [Deltaproteobacteria bacterium]|nr:glycosyltransferase [Deltaproteobacteria bacterium]
STLPPMVGGTAKMMRNLFSPFPQDALVFLRGANRAYRAAQDAPLRHVEVADMPNFLRRRAFRIGLPAWLEYLWAPWVAWRAFRIARRDHVKAIFGNYPFGYFLLAAWMASRLARLPLYVYMNSLWEETTDSRADEVAAHLLERRIFRDAARVYVPTEAAADHYEAKHGFRPALLPHAVSPDDEAPPAERGGERGPGMPLRILFTGGVYKMNRDALVSMIEAVKGMGRLPDGREVKLLVFAPNTPQGLAAMGIVPGERVETGFVDTQTAMKLQREVDLLYIPLAFETPWKDEVRTVFPTKAVEYMVSGTPILLQAPAGCYTVADARRHGWAEVVDSLDPSSIRAALQRLFSDEALRRSLVEGARTAAAGRDARRIARGLQADMGLLET